MASFDPKLYTGRWYEHGFHDWTQFGDVYDTTLDIELSKDGGRWLDDFALRGPAPKAAPISWDKSPVANGAHYFLYGKHRLTSSRLVTAYPARLLDRTLFIRKEEASRRKERTVLSFL